MSARSLKMTSIETLIRQDWFDFASKEIEKTHITLGEISTKVIKVWTEAFFDLIMNKLSEGVSISFKPIGHLVVSERAARDIMVPTKGLITVPPGKTVKLRNRASVGEYLKPMVFAKELANNLECVSMGASCALLKVWLGFLQYALSNEKRIELRRFGQFNIHKKQGAKKYNHHYGDYIETGPKTYMKFSPSKVLSDNLNNKK
jgi:nucleoid DNA-binding protein